MGIFSNVESGTTAHRSRFSKSISNTMRYDCRFHELVPVLKRFVLPGDVWRIGGDALVRFQPMIAPSMTPYNFRVRYFFVPLRLIEPNAELVITGSTDGKLYNGTLPELPNFVYGADKVKHTDCYKVTTHSFWSYMNVQCGDYENIKTDSYLPAQYWHKAYERIYWDYYRDENYGSFSDFETMYAAVQEYGVDYGLDCSMLKKDYFTSALPWQLKGVAPRLDVTGYGNFTPNYTGDWFDPNDTTQSSHSIIPTGSSTEEPFSINDRDLADSTNDKILDLLNESQSNVTITGLGFNADELRTMMAQTRIFERLARCGSRYTEYLHANFGTAPADDTLQRAQYLGGWKIPILTTEVLQTAEDGTTPVGTMRGHGISRGGNSIKTFYAKEFGVLFGLAEVYPNVEYTTGIPRELTYKKRFDFFNPSLQHLSEQEVKNAELYVSFTDGKNEETFGFQAYANELRSAHDEVVGDMREALAYWGSAIHFSSRPNLIGLELAENHYASFNAPFAVSTATARPIIVNFRNNLDVYRPMVRYATPGLVDHL